MRFSRLGAAFTSLIVIAVGFITVLGLNANTGVPLYDTVVNDILHFPALADVFLQLVVITTAVTILIGIFNLLGVHTSRVGRRKGGWFYSIVLIISAVGVIILYILERANVLTGTPAITTILLETVQVSIESALAGLVLFALVYGAYRMMRRRVTWAGILFTLVLLILLVGALPLPGLGLIASVRDWLLAVPVSAGARGILLGIALATVVTGVRVLIGQDRSYRE
jgi:hypothetical protein